MRNIFVFLRNFIKNPIKNASIFPSSWCLTRTMLYDIDFSKIDVIIELGAGEWVYTRELAKRKKPETKLIVIEIAKEYISLLEKIKAPNITIENVSAHLLSHVIKKHNLTKVDLIISGLPFLQEDKKKILFDTICSLCNQGTIFRNFTYMPFVFKKVYKDYPLVKKWFTFWNIPPAWVYGIN